MDEKLIGVLEKRRKEYNVGYKKWGEITNVMYTTLFRFSKGQGSLGIEALRSLTKMAVGTDDREMLTALASYALDYEFDEVK